MVKTLLPAIVILFLPACNNTSIQNAATVAAANHSLTQSILQSFDQPPAQQKIYAAVKPKRESFLAAPGAAIKQAMEQLKVPAQKFVIDNTQTAHITGAYGTRLSFNARCFVNDAGQEVETPVNIELKECYNTESMLRENLLTAGNNNFAASKGMLYVAALAGKKRLKLKAGESIGVQLPFLVNTADNGNLYYGQTDADGLVAWSANNGGSVKAITSTRFSKPVFSHQNSDLKAFLRQSLTYPDQARRNELSANVDVTFSVSPQGQVTQVTSAESYEIFRQVIEAALKNMPAWQPAVYRGQNIASSIHLNIDFNIRRTEQVQITFDETKARLVSAGNSVYLLYGSDLKGSLAESAGAQALTQMGWFNYRMPLHLTGPKAEVIVSADDRTEVRLLMKQQAAIVGGQNNLGYADFKNLPMDAEAYVIAVKYDAGQMFYAIQPVTTRAQTVITPVWKQGNEEDITKAYRQLARQLTFI